MLSYPLLLLSSPSAFLLFTRHIMNTTTAARTTTTPTAMVIPTISGNLPSSTSGVVFSLDGGI